MMIQTMGNCMKLYDDSDNAQLYEVTIIIIIILIIYLFTMTL